METKIIKKGQILLITLLVLMVTGIGIIGVIIIINRDTAQTSTNQKYQQVYNVAENKIFTLINKYGASNKPLSALVDDPDFTDCVADPTDSTKYNCTFVSTDFGVLDVLTTVTIQDIRDISSTIIPKDTPLTLNLSGYTGGLEFQWDKDTALDFLFVYQDTSGELKSISDTYNPSNVLDSPQNYNSILDPNALHKFDYNLVAGVAQNRGVSFVVGSIAGFNPVGTKKSVSLTITPRMKNKGESISLNAHATSQATFPTQARTFAAVANESSNSPETKVNVKTQIYLYPQEDGFWDHALLSNGSIF